MCVNFMCSVIVIAPIDVYFVLFVVCLQIGQPELPEGRMEKTGKFLVSFYYIWWKKYFLFHVATKKSELWGCCQLFG